MCINVLGHVFQSQCNCENVVTLWVVMPPLQRQNCSQNIHLPPHIYMFICLSTLAMMNYTFLITMKVWFKGWKPTIKTDDKIVCTRLQAGAGVEGWWRPGASVGSAGEAATGAQWPVVPASPPQSRYIAPLVDISDRNMDWHFESKNHFNFHHIIA